MTTSQPSAPAATGLELPPSGHALAHALVLAERPVASALVAALAEAGLGVLRCAAEGLGASDVLECVSRLPPGAAPHLLVGLGIGGAAALLAAPQLPSVRTVATVGAEMRPEDETALAAALSDGERAYLFLHAPADAHAAELYRLARHPKGLLSLPGADHELSQEADARYVGRLIAAWAEPYLALAPARAAAYALERSSVARTGAGLRTRVSVRGFELAADEPVGVGGEETAPTPSDYLAVALASCAAMTVRMYADRKNWPLEAVTVRARQRKAAEGEKIARFERTVELAGELDDEQRARLLEIANRCPVHRLLESGARIVAEPEETIGTPSPS